MIVKTCHLIVKTGEILHGCFTTFITDCLNIKKTTNKTKNFLKNPLAFRENTMISGHTKVNTSSCPLYPKAALSTEVISFLSHYQ